MRGLLEIPTPENLVEAYSLLQQNHSSISLSQWALWSQWARFDPRLAEQWVHRMAYEWKKISFWEFNQALSKQPWPQAVGVLLEFTSLLLQKLDEKRSFRLWQKGVLHEVLVPPQGGEQFFIGLRSFAGKAMRDDAEWTLKPYLNWGYLGREILIHKYTPGRWTLMALEQRKHAILTALSQHSQGSISDLQKACGGNVTRRQLERDLDLLKSEGKISRSGNTRGTIYQKRRSS